MAAFVRLKNEFTEDEIYHNLMTSLTCLRISSLCSWADWIESYLVENPED